MKIKNLIPVLIISFTVSSVFIACGPSAEEKAMAEQHMKDSIAAVEKAKADSILAEQQMAMQAAAQATSDSLAAIAATKATEDSLAAIVANKPKPKPKPKAEPKPDVPKVGSKKPGAK